MRDFDDSDESDEYENRMRRERSSPPGSPFHGFSSSTAPIGPDVLDGVQRLPLFPPRRMGWVTVGPRPDCPAFPQPCKGGKHVHTGRSRVGERRKYVQFVQHPVLAAQLHLARREDEYSGLDIVTEHGANSADAVLNRLRSPPRLSLSPTQEEEGQEREEAGQEQEDRSGADDVGSTGIAGQEEDVQGEEAGNSGGVLLNLFLSPTQGQVEEDLNLVLPSPPSTNLVPPPPPIHVPPPPPLPAQVQHAGQAPADQGATQDQPIPHHEHLPSLEAVCGTHIPTITWVPKGARPEFSRVFASTCNRVVHAPENISAWVLLLMFSKCVLPATKNRPDTTQARAVKDRLSRWRNGEFTALWKDAVDMTKKKGRGKKKKNSQEKSLEEANAERSRRLIQQGEYTRGTQALMSAGLAEHSPETVRIMRDKHPSAPVPTFQPTRDSQQLQFNGEQVRKAVMSFKRGTAPGPDGIRAEHLKAAIKLSTPGRQGAAEEALTKLVNVMAAGGVPDHVSPFLCGARLHAGLKKSGGIRPIAVGNILRRLTAKCCSRGVAIKAADLLSPLQLGVGVKGGLEAIIHTVKQALLEEDDEDKMLLQIDLINAFNVVDRQAAFKEVEEHFPEILKWVLTCYGQQARLMFGDIVILSQAGFHQGDPLASLLFSLTLQPIVKIISERIPDLLVHVWYLDDGSIVGSAVQLRQVVDIVQELGPPRGLHLSCPKSTVWCPSAAMEASRGADQEQGAEDEPGGDPLNRGIPLVLGPGVVLLGAPVGSESHEKLVIRERVEKIKAITDRLPLLKDPQSEFVILRSCLAQPKVMFSLRTTNPLPHQDLWQEFDFIVREALCRILGATLAQQQWMQVKLAVAGGGLGLRSATDHGPAAYAISVLSAQELKLQMLGRNAEDCPPNLTRVVVDRLNETTGREDTIESLKGATQREISLAVDMKNHEELSNLIEDSGSIRDKARLGSLGLHHAGSWLNVVPSPALSLNLQPAEFIVAVKYRLGMSVFPREGRCMACPVMSDVMGDHAISCGWGGERITRHNALRDVLFSTCQQAALAPVREDRALLPGTEARPADILSHRC